MLSIVDLDIEFAFYRVMDEHARLDVHIVVLVVPVRLERDRHSVPALRIGMAQSVTTDLDYALGHHVRLLVQVNVVLVGVVKGANGAY